MANRRSRSNRRVTLLLAALVCVLALTLLAGVVTAAHRDVPYRHSVDNSFAAAASTIVRSSNVTGTQLGLVMLNPGRYGRTLLESRLQGLDQAARQQSASAQRLAPPPPDANAHVRIVDTMRLRSEATASIRATLEGLLGLTPTHPAGTAGAQPPASLPLGVFGAQARLRRAGELLVLADHTYRGLPLAFSLASDGAMLPPSTWTSPTAGTLMPDTLFADAAPIARDPRLSATVRLSIVAVQTEPLPLPLGAGFPIPPTRSFLAAISVRNAGSAPTDVIAIIRAQPMGRLGGFDSGRATGSVAAGGAVALQLPAMVVVPGEHVLITIDLVRPHRQVTSVGLHWARTVVVAPSPPRHR
jgi:hypothetical protein